MTARPHRTHSDKTRNFKAFRVTASIPGRQTEPVDVATKPLVRRAVALALEAGADRIEVHRHTAYGSFNLVDVITPATSGEESR